MAEENSLKLFINKANEKWIIDRLRNEWIRNNNSITRFYTSANMLWIIAPWKWDNKKLENIIIKAPTGELRDNQKDREISVVKKEKTNKKIKVLTEKEIKKIKKDIKKKKTKERIVKKEQNTKEGKLKVTKNKKIPKKNRNIVNKNNNTFDVCTILEKCSIDEISKYLIKLGKKKNFPDITFRE